MSNTKKTLQDLTIRDNFLFAAVMQQGDNCKKFLEMLLKIKINRIDILYEKTIIYNPEYKGIRLDVYAKGDDHICYNIEMQVLSDKLPKRSRYYHSQMDMELLSSGESYDTLPDTYVIFICDFDPFGLQRYCYNFESRCLEDTTLSLGDGSKSIFLSTIGNNSSDISPELLSFLTFIRENQPEDLRDYHDAYVTQLQDTIYQIKRSKELGSRFMLLEIMLDEKYREGRTEGLTEGLTKGRIESILELLEDFAPVPAELTAFISNEKNPDTLQSWLKKASRAGSLEEFMDSISFPYHK